MLQNHVLFFFFLLELHNTVFCLFVQFSLLTVPHRVLNSQECLQDAHHDWPGETWAENGKSVPDSFSAKNGEKSEGEPVWVMRYSV